MQWAQSHVSGTFVGGVQSLSWLAEDQRVNDAGDVADGFYNAEEERWQESKRVKSGTFVILRVKDGEAELRKRRGAS